MILFKKEVRIWRLFGQENWGFKRSFTLYPQLLAAWTLCPSLTSAQRGQISIQRSGHPTTDQQVHHSSDVCNRLLETASTGCPAELPQAAGKTLETCCEENGSLPPCRER